jgi:hypothetical protein
MDYPQTEMILKGSKSLKKGGIEMTYQRWTTVGAQLLAWSNGGRRWLLRSRLGNLFYLVKSPDEHLKVEPVGEREARLFHQRNETELLEVEAFPELLKKEVTA